MLWLAHGRTWAWHWDVIGRWREQGRDGEVTEGGVNREGTLKRLWMGEGQPSKWGGEAVVPACGGVVQCGDVMAAVASCDVGGWWGSLWDCQHAHELAANPAKFKTQ